MARKKEPTSEEPAPEGETAKTKRDASRSLSRRKKTTGLRRKAAQAGFLTGSIGASAGRDQLKSLITRNNVRKMCTFVPERIEEQLAYEKKEFAERLSTAKEKYSTGAFDVLAPKVESLFRGVATEAMTRALEFGQTSITPVAMASVLRPYAAKTLFDTVAPPPGVVRHAQEVGALSVLERDAEEKETLEADAEEMQAWADQYEKERVALKERRSAAYKASGRKPPTPKAKSQ